MAEAATRRELGGVQAVDFNPSLVDLNDQIEPGQRGPVLTRIDDGDLRSRRSARPRASPAGRCEPSPGQTPCALDPRGYISPRQLLRRQSRDGMQQLIEVAARQRQVRALNATEVPALLRTHSCRNWQRG